MEDDGRKLTCITCKVLMDTQQEQVAHYKTDFHRFNLKRKLVNLPSVTQEQFEKKLEELKKEDQDKNTKTKSVCKVCRKQFGTVNAYKTHLNSNKHKEKEASKQQDEEDGSAEEMEDEEGENTTEPTPKNEDAPVTTPAVPKQDTNMTIEEMIDNKIKNAKKIELNQCIFCLQMNEDIESNITHMHKTHGFFIPDREYLKDVEGFIGYVGEKVSIGNVCLWCNEKTPYFVNLQACQDHMNALGHCKLAYTPEDEEEFADFYDFSSQEGREDIQEGNIAEVNDYEIILKNGKTIGHRALNRYYKQTFKPAEKRESVLINTLANQYKAIGWKGEQNLAVVDKVRQAIEASKNYHTDSMHMGIRGNFLWRYRKENVTTRNSGR